MKAILAAIRNLVGNNFKTSILIFVFVVLLVTVFTRCAKADELDLQAGASFSHSSGAVLGLEYIHPLAGLTDISFYAGTLLWGGSNNLANNWSWEGGLMGCRWQICLALGAAYLQRVDDLNGSHANYNLTLSWAIDWKRVSRLDITHLSNAGTVQPNEGRNAALVAVRLQ